MTRPDQTRALTSQHRHRLQQNASARAPVQQHRLQHRTHSSLCSRFHTTSSQSMPTTFKHSCRHFNKAAAAEERYGAMTRSQSVQRRPEMCVQQRSRNR
ncbi:unnamed protein product [Aureobasidium pullulans]|nr:unnamed protein product [Aureobasidium pullulans]